MAKRKSSDNHSDNAKTAEKQASYFLSLSLENVRCFGPKQTLDLSDGNGKPAPWTIILGVNGTGKTTILQSLAGFELVHPPHTTRREFLSPRFFQLDQQSFRRRTRSANSTAELWVRLAASSKLPALVKASGRYECVIEAGGSTIDPKGDEINPPWCCAYGAGRRMGLSSLRENHLDNPVASLFSDQANLRNPEEWLLRLDYGANKRSDVREQQEQRLIQATSLLLSILPEVDDVRLTTSGGTNPEPRAEFKTPYGWVPLQQLGYGYQTLITWITDFANRMVERYPDSRDPLAEPAVAIVDEIDLHLHPKWQRELMQFLTTRFPNTQFIATAHSPLVVQAAADANLAVLRREGDHVIIDNDVDAIRGWRIDQILTSDLFGLETARPPQIEKLLLERKKLLTKSKLTKTDKQRISELEEEIGNLPVGETEQDRKELDEIRKTLDLLTKS